MDLLFSFSLRRWRRYRQISRTLVRHGFGFLLERVGSRVVPFPRRAERLPALGPAHRLRLALEELGPTFIKLGQVLSTRPDLLPPAFIAELASLQDQVPSFPFEQARRQVEEALGAPLEQHFATFDPIPLAAASLSQVHAATLPTGEEVVVKVQRPGIEETIATDLEILRNLARLAEEQVPLAELHDICGIVEEFAHTLRGELDFRREGLNADRFRRSFSEEPHLYIPRICWDLTTRRVLTMERIYGIKIDDFAALDEAGLDRHRVAVHATEIVMRQIFQEGYFHADPHPGNFYVMPGEVIGAMDFGMVGRLSLHLRRELIRLFVVVMRLDAEQMVEQLLRMSMVEQGVDRVGLREDIERLLPRYIGRPLKEVHAREIIEEAMPIAFRRRLRLPTELWLLGKMLGMLEGVGLQLDPDFNPFDVARPYAEGFLGEVLSPTHLLEQAAAGLGDWANLLLDLPATASELAGQLQSGELAVGVEMRGMELPLAALDVLWARLGLGVLVAALFVVVALFLRPLLVPGAWWGWLIVGVGGVALLGLLVGFLLSMRAPV
jgi:ubiquinone biosynthesis protein